VEAVDYFSSGKGNQAMPAQQVGLIGLGLLGTALAERMLAGGMNVVGFDLDPARGENLSRLGGVAAASMADVVLPCDRLVLCLPDSRIARQVIAAASAALRPGMLIVDATTGDPQDTVAVAAELVARGVGYVDATVAGSSEQLRRGEAVILCGGTDVDLQRAELVLASWGGQRHHAGPAGSGAKLKLIVNLVLGLNRAVLAEGLALAEACGLDLPATLAVLKATPAYSRMMDSKGEKMIARDYQPQARLAQHRKDVRLILDLARRHDARTPLSALHEDLLQEAIEHGLADVDNSAIIEVLRKRPPGER
jgi:3-hydroxyisobutyrate dehydrogenase-like beta-hydroxyacid dehydrogenase